MPGWYVTLIQSDVLRCAGNVNSEQCTVSVPGRYVNSERCTVSVPGGYVMLIQSDVL